MKALLRYILPLIAAACLPASLQAFSPDFYAPSSVLAEGRWVKISVAESGPHFISLSTLRSWGFQDPSAVRIYGYGGKRINDRLSADNFIDDLPLTLCEHTDAGIVFYAQGPEEWTLSKNSYYNHSFNPYSTHGYYFLTDSRQSEDSAVPAEGSAPLPTAASTYTARLYHEVDRYTASESGHQLLGEDFRFNPSRTFSFKLPDKADNMVWMQCDFFATSVSAPLRLTFTANGSALPTAANDRVKATSEWGDTCHIRKTFPVDGSTLTLGINTSSSGTVKLSHLDKLDINYTAALNAPKSGFISFGSSARSFKIAGAGDDTRVWDVTVPHSPVAMRLSSADGATGWTNVYTGHREYALWSASSLSSLPAPKLVGQVSNQNIHVEEVPDMVIVTPASLSTLSRRIAELHEKVDGMKVLVLLDTQIYNEFGSGCPDVGAIRRMLKMFYDRGLAAGSGTTLSNVLLMGGATHDHRRLTEAMSKSAAITLPIWQTDDSHCDSYSYCSDDYITMLEDNSGTRPATDRMSIGVGRIPARSVDAAETYVKRLENYMTKPDKGEWRNKLLMFADDGNYGDHMTQTNNMEEGMRSTPSGRGFTFNKVYIDAYNIKNGTSEEAKAKVFNNLNDGVVLWTYIGHASINSLSGDGIFTPTALTNLYLRRAPFFYAACCTFGSFDGMATSGMESLLLTDAGGIIGCFTATRPSYITRNGDLSAAFGKNVFVRNAYGRFKTMGEIFRLTKNDTPDDNKRRYILFSDPALRLASPDNYVRLTSIDEQAVSEDSQPVIPALGRPVFRGEVCDPDGNRISDFNGSLSLTLYDAERSFTSLGRGDEGKEVVFDEQGERLFAGRTAVRNGEFEITITMPAEISDNFRNATLSMFASADNGAEASGVSRDLYVYGFDENAAPDNTAPVIEYLYLNHESFAANDVVNADPMLIARVSDDVAINMSSQGVGHQMSIRIDDDYNFTDVGSRFTPDDDGTPAGTIHYQLPTLSAGNHTATLKVWDTAGNTSSASIDFFVNPDSAPKIFDIYSDANPALTEANFYVTHNLPDATLTVKIEIYDINGRRVWDSESRGKADMYASAPVTWDLTNYSGSRVARGIYIYKATVTTGGEPSTQTKRIAVAPL